MPDRFKSRLLQHLKHENYSPTQVEHLGRDLGVPEDQFEEFEAAVAQLASAGQLVISDSRHVTLPPIGKEVIGYFKKNPKGFGFIIPRDPNAHGDLFVPPDSTLDALTGDLVRAKVVKTPGRGGRGAAGPSREHTGAIVEVMERKRSTFTGELQRRGSQWLVFPDGKTLVDPVVVRDAESKNAHVGDKVVFELSRHPEGNALGEGVIVKVLGASGEPDVETQAVIEAYDLPREFPEACLEQTREVTAQYESEIEALDSGKRMRNREDLREDYIITIDPPDAKDYDDAISIERHDGGWKLGVHIADVAHFIATGSALDAEAGERGNSVYLPRLVIPMLPELLSNGICSLQEGVARYCKSVWIEYDEGARVRSRRFANTLIKSAKRLTYLEAQALIDGDIKEARKHAKTEPKYTDHLIQTLREMNTLAQRIEARRRKQGMIHLELPEVNLIFDDSGRVVDAEPEDNAYTHKLIEMFMVEANEGAASLAEEHGVPMLRRTHPEPTPGDFDDLRDFVRVAGYKIPKSPTREELQGLLDATRGTPAAPAVHFAVLRTLTKAEYSPSLIGHFALASDAYAHFTSPIRRYPDLTVHRVIAEYLDHTDNGVNRPKGDREKRRLGMLMLDSPACPPEGALSEIGKRCNRTEVNASDAEHELRNFLVMQLLSEHIGEEFPGVVTGVTNGGVFVKLMKYLIEGLVKAVDLPTPSGHGGRWRVDQKTGALVDQGSGRSYRLGDKVAVVVAGVDLARRQMELLISDEESKKRLGVGKALRLGQPTGGGLGSTQGAGFDFDKVRTGSDKRAARSKSREARKKDFRGDRKKKGKL